MKKPFEIVNTIIILVMTIISTVLAFLVYRDHSQLNELVNLNKVQASQLGIQQNQLQTVNGLLDQNGMLLKSQQEQLKNSGVQTQILGRQLEENHDVPLKIGHQLNISQKQDQDRIDLDSVKTRINIYRLQLMANEIREILHPTNPTFQTMDTANVRSYNLGRLQQIFEEELENPIMLEDSSMLVEWIKYYNHVRYVNYEIHVREIVGNDIFERIVYNFSTDSDTFLDRLFKFLEAKSIQYRVKNLRYIA